MRLPWRPPKRYRGLRGLGQDWERLAEKHLKAAGYRIVERNYRTKVGELDFIALDGETLCFIEVKGRSGIGFGLPAEAITLEKQRRIFRAAEAFLQKQRLRETACRFDVVAILDRSPRPEVSILRGAFAGPLPPPRRS